MHPSVWTKRMPSEKQLAQVPERTPMKEEKKYAASSSPPLEC